MGRRKKASEPVVDPTIKALEETKKAKEERKIKKRLKAQEILESEKKKPVKVKKEHKCVTCGKEIIHKKRGRKPKYCSEHLKKVKAIKAKEEKIAEKTANIIDSFNAFIFDNKLSPKQVKSMPDVITSRMIRH